MYKPNIRITLSDLNIPFLHEGAGKMNDNSRPKEIVNLSSDESKTKLSDESSIKVPEEVDTNNTKNPFMQDPTTSNVPPSTAIGCKKTPTITRKDKALFDLFKNHLENELRYTDPEFNLKMAARELGTNEKYLSSAINNCSGISFNALVNRYRIAHAKKLIYDDVLTRHNLEEIAYMSGYSNRTTFYRVFTELEGTTPSRFRDNYNKDFSI